MNLRRLTAGSLLLSALSFAQNTPTSSSGKSKEREVTIEWKAVPQAKDYDIEISTNARLSPISKRAHAIENKLSLRLIPGTYYFRLKGNDPSGLPGPWSPVQGFIVNPQPPLPFHPLKGALYKQLDSQEEGLHFDWQSGFPGSHYVIEISDANGVLLQRSVDKNAFSWRPEKPGVYMWRIGFESTVGSEFSPKQTFTVTPEALALKSAPTVDGDINCRNMRWDRFRADASALFQTARPQYSGDLGWTPYCRLSPYFDLRPLVSASLFKGTDNQMKPILETSLLISMNAGGPVTLDTGFGLESWFTYHRYYLNFRADLSYRIPFYFDRIIMGYAFMPAPAGNNHFVNLGLGFDFGSYTQDRGQP